MFPDWSDARIWQAVVAGLFVAAGWLVNGWQDRREATRLRRHRRRDVHRALYAEIKHNLNRLGPTAELRAFGQDVVTRIAEEDFVPFVPRDRSDTVYRTVLPDLHILPRQTIDPIVEYYSQVAAHDALVDDMRGHTFRRMDPERRAAIYADFIAVRIMLVTLGEWTTRAIDAFDTGRDPPAGPSPQ